MNAFLCVDYTYGATPLPYSP